MTLLKKIEGSLVPLLGAEGFKKRSGEVFTVDLAEGFVGWLGLNRAKHPQGLELNPVVGVRCQELEGLLSTLLGERPHKYVPPSLSISLGYLMPEQQYRCWVVQEDVVISSVADMVAAIVRYGVPFVESACSLSKIGELLESPRFSSAENAMYRRPLIKWLMGDRKGALEVCASSARQFDGRSDLAAEHLMQFARGLESLGNQIDA
jgi:hypothetical protein